MSRCWCFPLAPEFRPTAELAPLLPAALRRSLSTFVAFFLEKITWPLYDHGADLLHRQIALARALMAA